MTLGTKNTIALGLLLLVLMGGCNIAAVQLKGTADFQKEYSTQVVDTFWDPEIAEYAVAASMILTEFNLKGIPEYEPALLGALEAFYGYGQFWLTEKMERAEKAGNFEEVEHLQSRIGSLYDRAALYSKIVLRLRDEDFDKALAKGWTEFEEWVQDNFYREIDADVLAVTGVAFALPMIASSEGGAAFTDRPLAEILLRRSVELNPKAKNARALLALGTLECATPKGVGGKPEQGYVMLQRAASITRRQSLGVLVAVADKCAVTLQNRHMFRRVLQEVMQAGDYGKYRLWNKFARYKAARLLQAENDLFFDE